MQKPLLFFLLMLSIPFFGRGQENKNQNIKKGILRTQGTISSGLMPKNNLVNIYLSGDLEYYISESISIRSDAYYFLSTMQGPSIFSKNHSSSTGALFHFVKNKNFDPYIGIQPGIAFSGLNCSSSENNTYACYTSFNPLLSTIAGFNYYAPTLFHLFMNIRYVNGKHLSEAPSGPVSLNEVKISFGLGWNFRVKK